MTLKITEVLKIFRGYDFGTFGAFSNCVNAPEIFFALRKIYNFAIPR